MGQPKGGATTETSQATSYAPWTQQMQQALAGIALGQNMGNLGSTGQTTAGFTPDQLFGQDQIRNMFGQFGPGNSFTNEIRSMLPSFGGMGGGQATASSAQAAQVTPGAIQGLINPFLQNTLDPALKNLRRERDISGAEIAARNAAAGSFGGSREAIERGQLDRSHGETVATMAAELMAQGWDRASALAQANAQMQQQTNLQNANNATQVSMANANNVLQGSQLAGSLGLQGLGLLQNVRNSDFMNQSALIQALLNSGGMQQGLAQNVLDDPYEALMRIAALVPPVYNQSGTSTQPNQAPSTLQQMLGLGLTIGGMPVSGGGSLLGNLFGGASA